MAFRVGIDIGGTFTDLVAFRVETGEIIVEKVPTTPDDPAKGFLNSLTRFVRSLDVDPSTVDFIVHGTTVATNALIQKKGKTTALLTTEGFRDVLEIGRHDIPKGHLYDPFFEKPIPLVPRNLRFEIPERIDSKGRAIREVDNKRARQIVEKIRSEKVDAVAISFLFSWLNPVHERMIQEMIRKDFANEAIHICASSDVLPEFREYERTSTTVVNAYLMPVMAGYLENIERGLKDAGVNRTLYVMQSSGGLMTSAVARNKPVHLIESGPSAGVVACLNIGRQTVHPNIISFDMGGTTAKAGLITNGEAQATSEYEVGGSAHGYLTGTGYPIKSPSIDLAEVGAGGGSIAFVDSVGALKVGPQSAGADPGPACYNRGGKEPTVTDANIVLGRISPDYFLGGRLAIDPSLSLNSIKTRLSDKLGMSEVDSAYGIIRLANANMIRAIRIVSTERGHDPRDYSLMAFGGAGPVHAAELAEELGLTSIIIPPFPGATSAYGFLMTDLRHDYVVSRVQRTDEIDMDQVNRDLDELEEKGRHQLQQEGLEEKAMVFLRSVDIRYAGQSYELNVVVPLGRLSPKDLPEIVEKFHSTHKKSFGHSSPESETQFVNLRVAAIGLLPKLSLKRIEKTHETEVEADSNREVYFNHRFVKTPVYRREKIKAESAIEGPAIVEEFDSTIVISPNWHAKIDNFGNCILSRQ